MPINNSDLNLEHFQQLAWQHRGLRNAANVAPEYGLPVAKLALAELDKEMAEEFMALLPCLGSFDDEPLPFSPKHLGIYLWRIDGQAYTNVPHLVIHHSPNGFGWGYAGSGPSDLALNIIEMILRDQGYHGPTTTCYKERCFNVAWSLHQDAKWKWLVTPELEAHTAEGTHKSRLSYQDIAVWVNKRMTDDH